MIRKLDRGCKTKSAPSNFDTMYDSGMWLLIKAVGGYNYYLDNLMKKLREQEIFCADMTTSASIEIYCFDKGKKIGLFNVDYSSGEIKFRLGFDKSNKQHNKLYEIVQRAVNSALSILQSDGCNEYEVDYEREWKDLLTECNMREYRPINKLSYQ